MKKETKIWVSILVAVIVIVAVVVIALQKKGDTPTNGDVQKSNLNVQSVEELQNLVTDLYTGLEDKLPGSLNTMVIDTTDVEAFTYQTGLSSTEGIEYGVISEPMMSSQAYSLILLKVADGVDANQIAKTMSESVDMRKWICVTAEKLYASNSGNIVCLVMSSEDWAKPVYENFKAKAGTVGQEYEKTEAI